MPLIQQLTHENPKAAFVSDLQLGWYTERDPRNADLAGSYSWTKQKIAQELPSVEALDQLRAAFEFPGLMGRRLWQAIYGQGKSHLALTLANFFGEPAGSPAVEAVLAGLEYAQVDTQALRSFKQEKGQFLVLCLFGNEPYTLAQGIALGLEAALKANPETAHRDLGMWFGPASKGLAALTPAQREQADQFLAGHDLSLAALEHDISSRRGQYREICAQALEHVAFRPDFGGVLAPQQMIERAGQEFCGPGKPFAGLLVLFDEFGRFTEDYARDYGLMSKNLPLQGLLAGIENLCQKGLGVLVAFTQFVPEDIAERAIDDPDRLEDLKKELMRFPTNQRAHLVSPLEAVLSDFLQQTGAAWAPLVSEHPQAIEAAAAAVDLTRLLFPRRYDAWTDEQMRTTLGHRCFPLHPLTTALLCTMGLRDAISVRPSLGFVQDKFREYAHREALTTDGTRLNCIPATELVEFFGEALAKDDAGWTRYQEALRLTGGEASALKKDILAAMFVHETANLAVGAGLMAYDNVIAALSGHGRAEVAAALHELYTDTRIQFDAPRKAYHFWSLSQDGLVAHRLLATDTDRILRDPNTFRDVLRQRHKQANSTVPVALGNRNRDDWAAAVVVIPRSLWSLDLLRHTVRRFQLTADEQSLNSHVHFGYVIRPVGFTDEDVTWLRDNAPADFEAVLQETDASTPPPAVLVLPQQPHAGLLRALVQHQVLHHEWSGQTKRDLSDQAIQELTKVVEEQVKVEVEKLRQEERALVEYRVPSPYQATVNGLYGPGATPNVSKVLLTCYEQAYHSRAPYVEDLISSNLYRADVLLASNYLSRDKFGPEWDAAVSGGSHGIAAKLYSRILGGDSETSWKVISPANRVSEPTHPRVLQAWKLLEEAVPVGHPDKVSLRPVMLRLLNAPYGYDSYSLGLLFSAWYGRNQRSIRLYKGAGNERIELPKLLDRAIKPMPRMEDIMARLLGTCDVYAQREEVVSPNEEITQVLQAWDSHEPMEYALAQDYLIKAESFVADETNDLTLREQVQQMLPQLRQAISLADDYAQRLTSAEQELATLTTSSEDTVRQARKLLDQVQQGFPLGVVQPANAAGREQLVEKMIAGLRKLYAQACTIYTTEQQTNTLTKCRENKDKLLKLKSHVSYLAEQINLSLVNEALATLERAENKLQEQEKDSVKIARLREIEKLRTLTDLRAAADEIAAMTLHSEKGQQLQQDVSAAVSTRIAQQLQEFANTYEKARDLPDRTGKTLAALKKDVQTLLGKLQGISMRYLGAIPEAEQLLEAQQWCNVWTQVFKTLEDIDEDSIDNAKELQKRRRKYDKLLSEEGINAAQRQVVEESRQQMELQFAQREQDAAEELNRLIERNRQQELAADVFADYQTAQANVFNFLPKVDEQRRKRLEISLRDRVEQSESEKIVNQFKSITDPVKKQQIIERLRQLLAQEQAVSLA